jgi:hypothetical protein
VNDHDAQLDDLRRYRFHTGAELRPLAPDEACPVLFRDLGTAALARYLRGTLPRLAGPLTPLLYARTVEFKEPYIDFERTGRVVFLRPRKVQFWHSGVEHIFVARATRSVDWGEVAFCPGEIELARVASLAREVKSAAELREALGGRHYDEQRQNSLEQLDRLNVELEQSERAAMPLRRMLQSRSSDDRQRARERLSELALDENDLCTAWHHLPRARRDAVLQALPLLEGVHRGGAR